MAHESKQVTKTSLIEFPKWRGEEGRRRWCQGMGLAAVLHSLVYYTWQCTSLFSLSLTRASCSTNQHSGQKPILAWESVTAALPPLSEMLPKQLNNFLELHQLIKGWQGEFLNWVSRVVQWARWQSGAPSTRDRFQGPREYQSLQMHSTLPLPAKTKP